MPIIKTYTSNEEAYRELKNVEYLQSSGTQYINTGIYPSQFTKAIFEIAFTSVSGTQGIMAVAHSTSSDVSRLSLDSGKLFVRQANTTGTASNSLVINNKYNIEWQRSSLASQPNKVIVDGNEVISFTASANRDSANRDYPLLALKDTEYGSLSNFASAKLYGCKLYYNDTLVRDYQPVVMNGVGYLYDKAEHKLYGNDGTGVFTYGSILDIEINPQETGFVDRYYEDGKLNLLATPHEGYEFVNWLLKGYTRLEYIESIGTQKINTNVIPTPETKFVVVGNFTNLTSGRFGYLVSDSSVNYRYYFGVESNKLIAGIGTSYNHSISNFNTNEHTFEINGGTLKIDNDVVYNATPNYKNYSFYLFNINTNATYNYPSSFRLKATKIYNDDVLVRDFIPVIRHTDGAIGLLDLVELKFYGNSGTGEFIGGSVYAS